jgi:hypothetical protein
MAVASAKPPLFPDPPQRSAAGRQVLNSWKDIAQFLKCGVRTAQRWERDLDLPVYRPRPGKRGPVCAFPNEIRLWLQHHRTQHPELAHLLRDGSAIATSHQLTQAAADLVRRTAANTRLQKEYAVRLLEAIRNMKEKIEARSKVVRGDRIGS